MSATTILNQFNSNDFNRPPPETNICSQKTASSPSRYESQKRRDWKTFGQYLRNHKPPLVLSRCSGAHILEFLRYLDQFGKTKVHNTTCLFFGHPHPPAPCPCPMKQAWGSLDALVGRLRAAFEENGGTPEANPFGARAVRLYLREVRDSQAKARGIAYEKKKRKKPQKQVEAPMIREHDEDDSGGGIMIMAAGSSGAGRNAVSSRISLPACFYQARYCCLLIIIALFLDVAMFIIFLNNG